MISMFAMTLLIAALGMPIYCILDNIPMIEMPKFIGCLFAGAIARNVMEACNIKFYVPEVDAIEHMFLELYLALVLMTTDITKLAPVAGQMGIILLCQALLMAAFAIFVSYNMFGRNYGAAVMAAGNCGWGCGSGPNAVANEKAVMDEYGWHNVAWVLYPSFAVIIDDIYNPIFHSEALSNKVHVHLQIINSLKRPAPPICRTFFHINPDSVSLPKRSFQCCCSFLAKATSQSSQNNLSWTNLYTCVIVEYKCKDFVYFLFNG